MTPDAPRRQRISWRDLGARVRRARLRWKILAALALLVVAVRVALPFALARAAASLGPSQLGLPVQVGDIDLALLGGRVAIEGVTVGRAEELGSDAPIDPERALLRWERVYANLEWTQLARGVVALQRLEIDGPVARLVREPDGRIDPLAHRPPSEPEPEAPEAEPGAPWPVRVASLALRQAKATLLETGGEVELASAGVEELSLGDVVVDAAQIGLGEVGIRNPRVRAARNFALGTPAGPAKPAPAAAPAPAPTAAPPADAAAATGYRIAKIEIQGANLGLESEAGDLETVLSLLAREITLDPGSRFPLELTLGIGDGKIAFRGEVGIVPVWLEGKLTWTDLPMPPFMLVGEPQLVPWLRSCSAGGELELALRTQPGPKGEPPGFRASGNSHVADFAFEDPEAQEIALRFERLELETRLIEVPLAAPGASGPPGPPRVELGAIRLVAPQIRWVQPATALERLRGGEAAAPAPADPQAEPVPPSEPAAPAAQPEISVASLSIEKGRLRFLDKTPTPPVDTKVRDFRLRAKNLRWPERTVQELDLSALVAGSGAVSLKGDVKGGAGKLAFALEHLPLPHFAPYAKGAGYTLKEGEATLQSDIEITREVYQLDNDLELHRLHVDAGDDAGRFQKQFGIPLDVALALLRDPKGDIDLPLPLKVDAKQTRVDLAPVVGGALRQALIGAMSSPLKAVGFILPMGGGSPADAFRPVAFAPGAATVSEDAEDQLEALTKLLAARPTLGLELIGSAGDEDRPQVAQTLLLEKAEQGKDWPEVEGSSWLARRRLRGALEARAKGEAGVLEPEDQQLLERTAAAVKVPDARLLALGKARAEALSKALAGAGVAAERLQVGEPTAPGPAQVSFDLFTP